MNRSVLMHMRTHFIAEEEVVGARERKPLARPITAQPPFTYRCYIPVLTELGEGG
jgi:hypothetical protein